MIYIYGGGVVGYCLAAHFEQFNIDYKLFTRNDTGVGYGLTIQEADNIIHFLNLKPDLAKINYLNRYVRINKECQIISSLCHSKGNYVIPRSYLIELFASKLNKDNVIHAHENITKLIELEDSVEFNIGSTKYKCDYLIGCDGINSQVRKFINITDSELLVDTNHVIKFIEYISEGDNKIRIFIKPNGCYGASMQLIHHRNHSYTSFYNVKSKMPNLISELMDNTKVYENTLYTSNKILPTSNRIILCGDALHPMTPYHGSGANCGIINAHILAKLFHNKCVSIADTYYDNIKETYNYVNQSFNTFYQIHCSNGPTVAKSNIYLYDKKYLLVPIPVNYISSNHIVEVKHNLTEVILAGIGLETFPEQLYNVLNLTVINLNDNKLIEIPSNIKLFQDLKELYLRNNRIVNITDETMLLQKLEILRLSYNYINNIDNLKLKNIKELCLTGNNLTSISDNINTCTNLVKLYCSDNEINRIANLNTLKKLKYLRIGYNPITYDVIYKCIDTILPTLYELRLSYAQITGYDNIAPNITIKYGTTLNKTERKQFEERTLVDKQNTSMDKQNFEKTLNEYILNKTLYNDTHKNNILDIVIKFNIFNTLDIISDTANTKLQELFLKKENINFMLLMFTLDMTKNIKLTDRTRDRLISNLETWFNPDMINLIITTTQPKQYTPEYISNISKLYNNLHLTIDMLTCQKKFPKHIGYPLNPKKGRPVFGDNKCYYTGCKFNTNSGQSLDYHLRTNVSGFIQNFHKNHEQILPTVIQNNTNGINMNYKCPVAVCKYDGDMVLHMKQLGFVPFWQPGDMFKYDDTTKDYKLYSSDTCMICIDNTPDVLFECGHKIMCVTCSLEYMKKTNDKCMLCKNTLKYFFISP